LKIGEMKSKVLRKIYKEMKMKCRYYEKCKMVVGIEEVEEHEEFCQKPKCWNVENCGKYEEWMYS
jgi:hypothetical protein